MMKEVLYVFYLLGLAITVHSRNPALTVTFDADDRNTQTFLGDPYNFRTMPTDLDVGSNTNQIPAEESVVGESIEFDGTFYGQARYGSEIPEGTDPDCLTNWELCTKGATIIAFIDPVNPYINNGPQETIFRFGDSKNNTNEFGLAVTIGRKKISVRAYGDESAARLKCGPHKVQGPDILAEGWFQLAIRIQPSSNGLPKASAIKLLINENLMDCQEYKQEGVNIAPLEDREKTIYIAGDKPERTSNGQFVPYNGLMDQVEFYDTDLSIPGVRKHYRKYKDRLNELNQVE